MRLFRGLYNLTFADQSFFERGVVATIGNFDGVHLGHQAILKRLTAKASDLSLPSLIILFEPHPQEFFSPEKAPARLFKLTDKLQALKKQGVDYVLCLRFNQSFSQMPAQNFIQEILLKRLNVKHLFIGDDFKFGHQRQGDFELLKSVAAPQFTVEANRSITMTDERISSSRVRNAIELADFNLASQLLGDSFKISGKVAHGDQQGRQIGFATANIALKRLKSPLKGVYAVRVYGISATPMLGVANIGRKPTLKESEDRLEVHIFDFSGDLYGRRIKVEPVAKIRNEHKFDSVEQLKLQITKDLATGRDLLVSG